VRRLVLAVVVVAVMVATVVLSPQVTLVSESSTMAKLGVSETKAYAQPNVGGPTFCGPWQQAWYVSRSGWWYFWWWRWCYNPSLPPSVTVGGGYYIDWAGWRWYGPAPPWLGPGWYYNGPPPY
jgi:hypothetical protein